MKFRKIFIFLSIQFSFLFFFAHAKSKEPDYCYLLDKITDQFSKEMEKEYSCSNTGSGGALLYDVKKIYLDFTCVDKLTIEEARQMIVKATDRLIQMINQDEQIRPYLHNFPFNTSNICLVIHYKDPSDYYPVVEPYVSYVMCSRGSVQYLYVKSEDKLRIVLPDYYVQHKESFEEAVEIVEQMN